MNVQTDNDDLLPEYNFDYSKAKSNRFIKQKQQINVTLDEDVARIFTTSDSVNQALRAILSALPKQVVASA